MRLLFVLGLVCLVTSPLAARTWTDTSGNYTLDAELVAFDEDRVVLQRDADAALGSVERDRLSEEDQAYLASNEAQMAAKSRQGQQQLWSLTNGLKVPGRVVDYVRRDVTVQRRRGHIYVNNRRFSNLPEVYQRIVPLIIGNGEGNEVRDEKTLEAWLVHRKGAPQTYTVDGVLLELESGDEYALPFFIFSEEDLGVLQPGWEQWLAASGDYETQEDRTLELQSLAGAYQQDAESRRQVAQIQLGLQAVDVGLTSLWEVTLYPQGGGQPLWVMAPGRDSRTAQANALANNPGYVTGPVRRLSR